MTSETAAGDPRPRCSSCGGAHEPDQQYCLECGARLASAPTAQRSTPLWAWALVVALALVAIVAGTVVALLASSEDDDLTQAAPVLLTITSPVAPPPPPVEPPITVPLQGPDTGVPSPDQGEAIPGIGEPDEPLTGEDLLPGELEPEEPEIPDPFDPAPLPPPDAPPLPPIEVGVDSGQWPAGTDGFTIILASIPESRGRSEADARAGRARAAGLDGVGVLRSSDYGSLRPGYWATFTGVYGTLNAARAQLAPARAAGFPSAYTRRVAP